MMGHLQHIHVRQYSFRGELRFDLPLHIAGQQERVLAVGDTHHQRVVIPGIIRRSVIRRRRQHLHARAAEREGPAALHGHDAHAAAASLVAQRIP